MRSLSAAENDTAGPCAPSRSVVSYMTIGFRADIKKPPDPSGWEVNRHQRRALRRGTSPANLDGDAALCAHAGKKARASAWRWVWFRAPNQGPGTSAAATARRCLRVFATTRAPVHMLPLDKTPGRGYGLSKPIRQ